MNRDVCEHFNPVDLPCAKCEKPTLREAAQAVLDRWDSPKWEWHQGPTAALMADLRAALAEPVQEPVAWMHNLIDNIITHRPADIDRHPGRWTALYKAPQPCPTCVSLARTVMMDQTGHDPAPPQRKPLTEEEIAAAANSVRWSNQYHVDFARAIERAHGIGDSDE